MSADPASEAYQRQQALVDELKADGSIQSPAVEAAFRAVARHHFIPEVPLDEAYANQAIATKRIDNLVVSSTSQPGMMAIMLEMLTLQPGHRVLEIGAGTGYNAALMAEIVGERGEVVAIDIDEDIVEAARAHLAATGYHRVRVLCGDGALGAPDAAPFDRIVLTVAATDVSPAWREQLSPHGRLLLPLRVGGILTQKVVLFEAAGDHLESVDVRGGWFIMLRGTHGQEQRRVQLEAASGLALWADTLPTIPPATLFDLVSGPARDSPTGVQVTRGEMWGGLLFWLGLHEPSLCQLVTGSASLDARHRRWPLRYPSGDYLSTIGLVGTDGTAETDGSARADLVGATGGVAVLAGPPVVPPEPLPADRPEPYEVVVQGYGDAEPLARRLIALVRAWEAAGRPSGSGLRIRAYPAESPPDWAGPGEIVIQKPRTRLVVDWS